MPKLPNAAVVFVPTPFKSVTGANNALSIIVIQLILRSDIQVDHHHEFQIQDHHVWLQVVQLLLKSVPRIWQEKIHSSVLFYQ